MGIQGSQAGCEIACAQTFPDGAALFAPYFACAMVECAVEQVDCDEASRTACEACLYESCGAAYVALMVDPYGYQLVQGVEDCPVGDSACDGGCYDAFPTAFPAWQAYADCVAPTCTSC